MQAIKQQFIPALFDCVLAYFLTRLTVWTKERSTSWRRNKPLAKNALPAAVVPRSVRAKGNREERGGHHAAIWTDFSAKHTEEIKVMQAPFKCASMLGHRLRVDKYKDVTHTHTVFLVSCVHHEIKQHIMVCFDTHL